MIFIFKKLKIISYKLKASKLNRGMTYVELIVVLMIFATISSIVLFNYQEFQTKVNIKNLASDIALKIVEAQKSAISGKLSAQGDFASKPAYGIYFNQSPSANFIYFADFDNDKIYTETPLDTILIPKNYSISRIDECSDIDCSLPVLIDFPFSITFKRPDSKANFTDSDGNDLIDLIDLIQNSSDYIRITIKSPQSVTASIKIYPSGRIQVN